MALDILYCDKWQLEVNKLIILLLISTEIGEVPVVFRIRTGRELTALYAVGICS